MINLLARLGSFLLDFLIAWIVLNSAVTLNPAIAGKISQLDSWLATEFPFPFNRQSLLWSRYFLIIYLLHVHLRFYTTLIFGPSLGQLLSAIKPSGNQLWKRIGGGLRVLVGGLTGPLIIFELNLFSAEKTLKEYITGTTLKLSSPFRFYLSLPLLPLLLLGALYSELLLIAPPFLTANRVEKASILEKSLENSKMTEGGVVFSSHRFRLETSSTLDDREILLIPGFELHKQHKLLRFRPSLHFYHRDLIESARFSFVADFSLRKYLFFLSQGDPLFSFHYPELSTLLKNRPSAFAPQKYRPEFQGRTLLSKSQKQEIVQAFSSALALNSTTYRPFSHFTVFETFF